MAQSLSSLQKSGTLKLITYFILPLFGVPKLRSVAQNEWKKHPYAHILSTFGLKINKLKRKKMKKQKKSKPKSCMKGNYSRVRNKHTGTLINF